MSWATKSLQIPHKTVLSTTLGSSLERFSMASEKTTVPLQYSISFVVPSSYWNVDLEKFAITVTSVTVCHSSLIQPTWLSHSCSQEQHKLGFPYLESLPSLALISEGLCFLDWITLLSSKTDLFALPLNGSILSFVVPYVWNSIPEHLCDATPSSQIPH